MTIYKFSCYINFRVRSRYMQFHHPQIPPAPPTVTPQPLVVAGLPAVPRVFTLREMSHNWNPTICVYPFGSGFFHLA